MSQPKINFSQLNTGYEFEPASFRLSDEMVTAYLDAVGGNSDIYRNNRIAPPMLVAALAMAAMAAGLSMPPGAIHVSQEVQFLRPVEVDGVLTSYARVNRKVDRGKFHMLTIGIKVMDQAQNTVLSGETGFLLPFS